MIMKEKVYDYIIYPANLLGCVYAIKLAKNGASVLLLNNYGFTGGDITHSLSCYQKILQDEFSGLTKEIFIDIVSRKNSVFYINQDELVINPELVKIVFQENLVESKIDLLFHILPYNVTKEGNLKNIFLSAKEGTIIKKANNLIDTSENYSLMRFAGLMKKLSMCAFNLFLCKSSLSESENYDKIISHTSVYRYIKLDDSRYWISLNIPIPENELFIENISQKVLNEFEMFALKNGGRVQLVASQTFRKYEVLFNKSEIKLVSHPKLNSIKSFYENEIFLEANYFEKKLSL